MKKIISSFCLLLLLLCITNGSVLPANAESYQYSAPSVSVDYKYQDVRIFWNKKGKSSYRVFYRQPGKDWQTLVKSTDKTSVLVTPKQLTSGKTYQFSVRCMDQNGKYSSPRGKSGDWKYYAAPALVEAKPISSSAVSVSWKKVSGVSKYRVYYKQPGESWIRAGVTNRTTMEVKNLKNNKDYIFTVRCMDKSGKKTISGYVKAGVATHTWLKVPAITSCISNKQGGLDITWNPVKGASGYRVRYRLTSEDIWTYSSAIDGCSFSTPKLKDGKRYKVAVYCLGKDKKKNSTAGCQEVLFTSLESKKRFVVTNNYNYSTKACTLGKYATLANAKKAISGQPSRERGQWFVIDAANNSKVVYPDLSTRQKRINVAVAWAKAIAADSSHGYRCDGELRDYNVNLSHARWGNLGDYSCSTLVATAYELAGIVNLRDVTLKYKLVCEGRGDDYSCSLNSSNMAKACIKSGKMVDVTDRYDNHGTSALKPGDILINNSGSHVAMYIGDGDIVEARMNELGSEYAIPKAGDQTGHEICISSVGRNWGTVLRAK